MVQVISDPYSGNIFGRIGHGIGKGLSEQLPKEIERSRLSAGLKKLGEKKDQQGLSPFQFTTEALGIPGITPQAIDTLGRLALQDLKNKGIQNLNSPQSPAANSRAPNLDLSKIGNKSEIASVTTREPLENTLHPYVNPTTEEINRLTEDIFSQSPGYFHNDIGEARDYVRESIANEATRNAQLREQRVAEQGVQNTLLGGFREYLNRRGINIGKGGIDIPRNELEPLEQKLIKSILPLSEGGQGFTEEQAARFYEKEADKIARDYSALRKKGGVGKYFRSGAAIRNELEPLRKKFAERNMLENFADELIPTLNVAPRRAYALAYPIEKNSLLGQELFRLPNFTERIQKGGPRGTPTKFVITEQLSPILAGSLQDNSVLAVADALAEKGYDPDTFLKYVTDNEDKLNLSPEQIRELTKSRSALAPLGNIYHQAMGVK